MNAGLSNLATLKAQLLAVSMQSKTNYDPIITAIGQGVAGQFDKFCNRKFSRVVGEVDTFSADRRHWYLKRYPVETISALAKKDAENDGWVPYVLPPDGNSLIQVMQLDQGYIMFISIQGYYFSRITCTYNGGYWFDTSDPSDAGYSGPQTIPPAATPLPSDVQLAWFLACKAVWKRYDPIGAQIAQDPEPQHAMDDLKLPKAAQELLNGYKRYQIS
jgi:hypothetical protein